MMRPALAILLLAACGLAIAAPNAPVNPRVAVGNPSDATQFVFHEPARIDELPSVRIAAADAVRFIPVEIHINTAPVGLPGGNDARLAAWQFDLTCDDPAVRIVGIEGSTHKAFNDPPHYDPAAMKTNRVIVAAYNTSPPADLPHGKLRIATVNVMIPAGSNPTFTLSLTAAADANAKALPHAVATLKEGPVR